MSLRKNVIGMMLNADKVSTKIPITRLFSTNERFHQVNSSGSRFISLLLPATKKINAILVAPQPKQAFRSIGMHRQRFAIVPYRGFADGGGEKGGSEKNAHNEEKKEEGPKEESKAGDEGYDEDPGQKMSYVQLAGAFALLGLVGVCGYNIVVELFPTRMSPNHIFSEAVDKLQADAELATRYGTPLNAYGKDHGGKREGRRNFIENTSYKGDDGSNRVRVRFNIKGPYGHGLVFAEVSDNMKPGEYVYLMVQDVRNGQVHILEDNRIALAEKAKKEGKASSTSGGASEALNRLRFGGN